MAIASALITGLIFGFGLIVSGMVNPARVSGFLDVAGTWDPSLAFVMAGAIAVGAPVFYFVKKMPRGLTGQALRLPAATGIDYRLICGGALFGIGWGLAGFCPGPALVGAGAGVPKAVIFVGAMLAGMILFRLWEYRTKKIGTK
jgi:uncharacterized membrane protein YedE/YeeE